MKVLLDDHVAPAGERRVLLADEGGVDGSLVDGILRPIDETEQVAIVEVLEAVHFVRRGDGAIEPRHDLCRQFEAQIHARGADMEEDVPRRRDSVMHAPDFLERMQFLRPRRAEQPVPGVGAERHDAGQPALEVPEPDGAQKTGQVAAQAANGGFGRRSRIHRHHEKHGGTRERRDDRLRNRGWHASLLTDLSGAEFILRLSSAKNKFA